MESIHTTDAPAYGDAPLSQGTVQDGLVYASGQLGVDPDTGELVSSDVTAQTNQVFDNLSAVLEAGGSSLDSVVNATVFLADLSHYDEVNDVYRERLSEPYPSRSAIGAGDLLAEGAVEIELIAAVE
jgi:2-iminobutanoate/2-iminopropanoate deaminase